MARKCFMCGREVTEGILCEKCDKPRRKSQPPTPAPDLSALEPKVAAPAPRTASDSGRQQAATAPQMEPDPFPKAPILPFPVESASPAITSVVNLLVASGVPAVIVGPDRSVKFVSDEAKKLFDAPTADLTTLAAVEAKAGVRVGDLTIPNAAGVRIGGRNFIHTLVPMSGGASGAVLVFRQADPMNEAHVSFVTYVRECPSAPPPRPATITSSAIARPVSIRCFRRSSLPQKSRSRRMRRVRCRRRRMWCAALPSVSARTPI
jgi:hypothetical protein